MEPSATVIVAGRLPIEIDAQAARNLLWEMAEKFGWSVSYRDREDAEMWFEGSDPEAIYGPMDDALWECINTHPAWENIAVAGEYAGDVFCENILSELDLAAATAVVLGQVLS